MTDLSNLCCCCLTNSTGQLKNMLAETFQITSIQDEDAHITEYLIEELQSINLIEALGLIGVSTADLSPTCQKICSNCEQRLKYCVDFHQLCQKSQQTLKNIKEEGSIDELTVEYENEQDLLIDTASVDGHSYVSDINPIDDEKLVDEELVVMALTENSTSPSKNRRKVTRNANQKPYPKQIHRTVPAEDVQAALKTIKQTDSTIISDDVHIEDLNLKSITSAEAALVANYICFHCDRTFLTFLTYVGHRESHKKTKGFTTINRTCPLCNQYVEGYVQHLQEQHKNYRPNRCEKCKYSTLNQYQLVQHMVKHLTQKTLQCRACNEMYNHPKSLSQHIRTHFDSGRYFCPLCGYFASKIADLLVHKSTEHDQDDQRWFPCSECKRIYFKFRTLETHKCTNITEALDDENHQAQCNVCDQHFAIGEVFDCHRLCCENHRDYLKCQHCDIGFRNRRCLQKHFARKHSNKEFVCEFCSRSFTLRVYLQTHLLSHSNYRPEKCDICDKNFKSKLQLSLHKAIHREKEFECAKCGKKFAKKDSLKTHLRKHFKVLCREKCPICEKMFGGLTPLRIHMRTHTGEKPFQCEECNKCYYTKHSLKSHNEKVHNHKRYDCKFCDKSFSAAKSIYEHAFTHKGYSPFNCPVCYKKFTRKDGFKKHLAEHRIQYDEEIHGFNKESHQDVVMSVLKTVDDQADDSIAVVHVNADGTTTQVYESALQIISEEIVEEEIIDYDDGEDNLDEEQGVEQDGMDGDSDDNVVFENYLITHI